LSSCLNHALVSLSCFRKAEGVKTGAYRKGRRMTVENVIDEKIEDVLFLDMGIAILA